MKVALYQTDTVWKNPEANLSHAEQYIASADASLVILPEMFATGYCTFPTEVAEKNGGRVSAWMLSCAARYGKAVSGSVAVEDGGKYFNRMFFAMPDGNLFHYDKRHLFSFCREDEQFSMGRERIIVDYGGCRIMPLVCYDLRFPAWSYMPGKVDLIVYSASWSASRVEAWDKLLAARAIENQAYVIGVNRVGTDAEGTLFNGHSAAYDYFGRMIACAGEKECGVTVEIDTDVLNGFRDRFRAWQDADKFEFVK